MAEWIVDFHSKKPQAWFEDGEIRQELVRCRNCRFRDEGECPMLNDYSLKTDTADGWYCADGRKRDD